MEFDLGWLCQGDNNNNNNEGNYDKNEQINRMHLLECVDYYLNDNTTPPWHLSVLKHWLLEVFLYHRHPDYWLESEDLELTDATGNGNIFHWL